MTSTVRKIFIPQILFAFAISIGFAANLYSQVGITSVPFLKIEPEARSAGLGNTGVSDTRNIYAGFWNPSILAHINHYSFGITHSDWLPGLSNDLSFDNISGILPVSDNFTLGFDALYFNLGRQNNTDDNGNVLGAYGNYEFAVSTSAGYLLSNKFSIGANIRYVNSSIGNGVTLDNSSISSGSGFSYGLGLLLKNNLHSDSNTKLDASFGLYLSNLGSGIQYGDSFTLEPLPTQLRLGYSVNLFKGQEDKHRFSVYNDFTKNLARSKTITENGLTRYEPVSSWDALFSSWGSADVYTGGEWVTLGFIEQWSIGSGLEYSFLDKFMLRGGYYKENKWNGGRNYITTGLGLNISNIQTDISYLISTRNNDPMANTVRISLRLNLKREKEYVPNYIPPTFIEPNPIAHYMLEQEFIIPTVYIDTTDISVIQDIQISSEILADSISAIADEMINFDRMSSKINTDQKLILSKFVDLLSDNKDIYLDIEGHTDSTGNFALNKMLSEARSRAVWLYLVEQKIDWKRIDIEGLADTNPLSKNSSEEGMALNRRATIVLDSLKIATTEKLIDIKGQEIFYPDSNRLFISGNPLEFEFLDIKEEASFRETLGGILTWLNENPLESIDIAYHINYSFTGNSFERELEKARSEKIKSIFIRNGISNERINVVRKDMIFSWQDNIHPFVDYSKEEYLIIKAKS